MTNFKYWIFTRYDMKQEFKNESDINYKDIMKPALFKVGSKNFLNSQEWKSIMKKKPVAFEYSETFDILKIDEKNQTCEINFDQLA